MDTRIYSILKLGAIKMDIKLTEKATKWFEDKFPLNEGEAVRFFGKTYGKTDRLLLCRRYARSGQNLVSTQRQ